MPMCTYLGDTEFLAPTGHKAIDEAVADLRKQTGDDWRAGSFTHVLKRWFRKPVKHTWYALYINVGFGEFQCINFYRDGTDWSINPDVSAELIVAYCYGYLAGDWHARRKPAAPKVGL